MKILNKVFSASAVALAALAMTACVSEAPFETQKEGTLRLNAELRGDITSVITRAAGYDKTTLENNLVVYIQKENVGVVRKFLGLQSLQGTNIALQTGHYVLEGWSGDSVSASFDKKFYYGYKAIDVKEGSNAISLNCDIANVLASVNTEYVAEKLSDLTVEIGHTRGSLTFDYDLISSDPNGEKKGYFMMPKGVTDLTYKISGKNTDGVVFNKEGEIKNALRAHDYQFVLKADASQITQGGALIQLEIVEVPTIDEVVTVFPAPSFKATMGGEAIDPAAQLDFYRGDCSDINLRVLAYKGMPSLKLSFSENFPNVGGMSGLDVIADGPNQLPSGITTQMISETVQVASSEDETVDVVEYWFSFPASYIKSLPSSESEYAITFDVTDGKGFTNQLKLRWANTDGAIERLAPVGSYTQDEVFDFTAISATRAMLYGALYDESVSDFGIRIREQGASEWTSLPGELSRANATVLKFSVEAKGLKPATTYEYKSYAGDLEEQEIKSFTTEAVFTIPNASFEDWSSYSASTLLGTKDVKLPWSVGDKDVSFWGSGNEGAATANKVLTKESEDMVHSGKYSARLGSDAAMGIIAAGNIFTGKYVKTDGTNGVLSVGAPYNGSHPSSVRVFANYRPGGGVSIKDGTSADVLDGLTSGGTDQGQIYVALTTEPYEIRTNPSKRKLFDKNDPTVVAYGQVTWKEAFGPDGELQELNIPFDYNAKAKTVKPTYLVIVCSASKFGDYFCGSSSSVMYLDDFELIYE